MNKELNFPQTSRGSFSAVSTPIFASKYSLESSRREHSFAPFWNPFSNLNFFVKNRQNVFAIELMNFINSIARNSNFAFLSANF